MANQYFCRVSGFQKYFGAEIQGYIKKGTHFIDTTHSTKLLGLDYLLYQCTKRVRMYFLLKQLDRIKKS